MVANTPSLQSSDATRCSPARQSNFFGIVIRSFPRCAHVMLLLFHSRLPLRPLRIGCLGHWRGHQLLNLRSGTGPQGSGLCFVNLTVSRPVGIIKRHAATHPTHRAETDTSSV